MSKQHFSFSRQTYVFTCMSVDFDDSVRLKKLSFELRRQKNRNKNLLLCAKNCPFEPCEILTELSGLRVVEESRLLHDMDVITTHPGVFDCILPQLC